jgi:hypothetical protein
MRYSPIYKERLMSEAKRTIDELRRLSEDAVDNDPVYQWPQGADWARDERQRITSVIANAFGNETKKITKPLVKMIREAVLEKLEPLIKKHAEQGAAYTQRHSPGLFDKPMTPEQVEKYVRQMVKKALDGLDAPYLSFSSLRD